MSTRGARSSRRALGLSAVVLIHGAIVLVAWQLRTSARHVNAQVLLTTMRLIEPRAVPPAAVPASPLEAVRSSWPVPLPAPLPMPSIDVQPAPSPAAVSTAPMVDASLAVQGRVGLDGRAISSPGPAASAPTGLALKPSREVLRGALANLATSDPRSNSPKPTFEEKIAMGLDETLCLQQERLPDGSVRRRLVHRSAGQTTLSSTAGLKTGTILVCE